MSLDPLKIHFKILGFESFLLNHSIFIFSISCLWSFLFKTLHVASNSRSSCFSFLSILECTVNTICPASLPFYFKHTKHQSLFWNPLFYEHLGLVCEYVCVCTLTCVCVHACVCVYIVCMHASMCVHMSVCLCACMRACMSFLSWVLPLRDTWKVDTRGMKVQGLLGF